jgi:hypothetical protein
MSLQSFVKDLIVSVIEDPKTQTAIENIIGNLITKQILPLVPVATAAAAKAAVDEIVKKIPELSGVVDVVHVADEARDALNKIIPDFDLGIPALDNLIDFWRPKSVTPPPKP